MKKIFVFIILLSVPFTAFAKGSFFYDGDFGLKYDLTKVKQNRSDEVVYSKFQFLQFEEGFSFGLCVNDDFFLSFGATFIEDAFSARYRLLELQQRLFVLARCELKYYIASKFMLKASFLYGGVFFYKDSNYASSFGFRANFGYAFFENKEKSFRVVPSLGFSWLRSNFCDDFSFGIFISLERRAK